MQSPDPRRLAALLAAIGLAGCGAGGGGGSQVAGIDRLGVSSGVVTGFGSIFVNGAEIATDTAQFIIDDDPAASQASLRIGDVVAVTFDPAAASPSARVVFSESAVRGPASAVDLLAGTLRVAGQPVRVDGDTAFGPGFPTGGLADVVAGDFLRVAGLFDAAGAIRATRIERLPGGSQVEVRGRVAALDTVARTLELGGLVVDYGTVPALIDAGFPGGVIADGDFVEIKGTTFTAQGALLATSIEPDGPDLVGALSDDFDDFDEIEIEIEGFVTRFVSSADFDVSGFPVRADAGTVIEGPGVLGLDVRVEVEGELDANGVLVADEIELKPPSRIEIDGLVDAVDAVAGTVTVLGVVGTLTPTTRVEDQSSLGLEPFGLADLAVDDYVLLRGGDPGDGTLALSRLERKDRPDELGGATRIQGPVSEPVVAPPDGRFTILGVTVETSAATEFDDIADEAEFYVRLAVGDLVDAEGTEVDDRRLVAEEVEFEADDDDDDDD